MKALGLPFDISISTDIVFANLALAMLVLLEFAFFVFIGLKRRHLLTRPAIIFSVFIFVFYAVPSLFFSKILSTLPNELSLLTAIHLPLLGLLCWALFTSIYSRDLNSQSIVLPNRLPLTVVAAIALLVLLPIVYFARVPYDCTAIYALIFDPRLSLLAREFGIKLVGTSNATYAFGALANAVVPFLVSFGMLAVLFGRPKQRWWSYCLWLVLIVIGLSTVLIGGAKGLLAPTLISASVAIFSAYGAWWKRLIGGLLPFVLLAGFLVAFQLITERGNLAGGRYNFASCSYRLGVCSQSKVLMESLLLRDMSLGMPLKLSKKIQTRLTCYCNPSIQPKAVCDIEDQTIGWNQSYEQSVGVRAMGLFEATVRRAFVVPLQVAAWHFGYVAEEGAPGWRAMPFARRIYGESVNVAELAYQKFGIVYSDGDKTSTSTAPTGFFLAYPAYLGWSGLLLGLVCFIGLDFLISHFMLRMPGSVRAISLGLVSAMSMNLMVSDLVTTLLSHGGLMIITLALSLAVEHKFNGEER